jgi:hypothetical protein
MVNDKFNKILFFGYGSNRSKQKIREALQRDPGQGIGAILHGFTLNVQSLNQIPPEVQKFFQQIYGNDFKAYTIKEGKGIIAGVIWQITNEDLEKLKKWEFVGPYREIIEVEVTTTYDEVVKAYTEKSLDSCPTTFVVDGLTYDVFAFAKQGAPDPNTQQYYTQEKISEIRKWLKLASKNQTA